MERFWCATQMISGADALSALSCDSGKRLMLVTCPGGAGSREAERLRGVLRPEKTACFDDILPEPTLRQAVEGARQIREFRPELVVALGGSHVLDCAKAMVCFSGHSCGLTVVPTEFGSGVETLDRVSLFHSGARHTLHDEKMRPDRVVMDASLLNTMSRSRMGEGGFFLLASSIQAYTARDGGMLSAMYAREAFVTCWAALPAALAGSEIARERVMQASAMAGISGSAAGLGLCHALCGALESVFHVPEGRLAAVLLPELISCSAYVSGRKYAELARAAGLGGGNEQTGIRNLRTGLLRLRRELGLPGTLAQAGIDPRQLRASFGRIAALTLQAPECREDPVGTDDFLIRRVLETAAGQL